MNRQYLNDSELPFCKGCGHALISDNTDKALQKTGLQALDITLVTDIGCHGIIDKSFKTHTLHGLHGRSVALASGLSAGLNDPNKKVIVFIGDGGATIGMQHLVDAAHNQFNMTVVIHNNFLYGMTGGQPSEFTPEGFKTPTLPEGNRKKGYDICKIVTAAGANYASRVIGIGDISDHLATAFSRKGFSLVEVMEICPSYGLKSNPGMKLSKIVEDAGLKVQVYADRQEDGYQRPDRSNLNSLLDSQPVIPIKYKSKIQKPVRIMINGSAGEGVQSAAEFFAQAAMTAGLNVTKKGSYPVTVGIGFSSSDIIISPDEILYTGSPKPDVLVIISDDGLEFSRPALAKMNHGLVLIDSSLPEVVTKAQVIRRPFREKVQGKNAALFSLLYYLHHSGDFPYEALFEIISNSKLGAKMDLKKFTEFS